MTSLRTASKAGVRGFQRERQEWKRAYGPPSWNPAQLARVACMGAYEERYKEILLPLWRAFDYDAYFKAVRVGRQACFVLSGIHLAAQRRAVSQ